VPFKGGLAVLVLERDTQEGAGTGRGCSIHRPLAAFADIVISMDMPRVLGPTRRRTFTGVGRYPAHCQPPAPSSTPMAPTTSRSRTVRSRILPSFLQRLKNCVTPTQF
jgi:hypothetical protein